MRKNSLKVAVIGGGSSYTPELIEGFIRHHGTFPVQDLYLADIEGGRHKLDIVGALARRMIEKAGVPIRLHTTLDRREAIGGADFVLTQMRVGFLEARSRDEKIPLKYGLIGQETTGAGGFAKALRTIPVILDICRDIEELAPEAFLINFTNPAGLVTEAVLKHSRVKTMGLCNLPIGTRMQIAGLCGVDVSEIDIEMAGINHLTWTTRIAVGGTDITAEVLNKAAGAKGLTMKNIPDFGWDPEFLQSVGALPCSYHKYYYMKEKMLEDMLGMFRDKGTTRADDVKQVEAELFELYKDPDLAIKPPQLEKRGGAYYSEAAVNLIKSIYTNTRDIQTVNVRNNGILPFLPDDASVEVNCVIDAAGAHPLQIMAPIPAQIRGLLQIVKAYEELTVKAAVAGDYSAGLQALTLHPLVGSSQVAKQLLDDILASNRDYLPQFQ
ncbi:diacetylchitobiose-6-phosphate hydrolase [Gordoniibacillus kamchatkensis]|uniref:Diacetylchitobiose-6-phosphate hydrolase n=1 Tax=Gordoniibacillus kamchatkensis TaxID=1590651 RepID=A0ABR5ADW4_9BACL|nr:6-phospho-beta-glucosidase [Paenibacillus sp. VKM B-2647]KIL39156.1 diacetylchitobiose-6-phosphate hydrolase [Paenibacillus sp. VKM B-2647]